MPKGGGVPKGRGRAKGFSLVKRKLGGVPKVRGRAKRFRQTKVRGRSKRFRESWLFRIKTINST